MTEEAMAAEAAAPTGEPAATTEAQASWLEGLGDHKGYAETKGWKDPAAAVESYRNLEKLRGVPAERLMTLPEDMTADGALDTVWDRLGRPEAADKYTNALGETFADGTFKDAAAKAHALGMTDKQFAGMQEWLKGTTEGIETARREEIDGAFKDWSEANPQALQNVKRLTAAVGIDDVTMDKALNGDKAGLFDMLGKVAARMGESRVVQGEGDPQFGMSPAAAKAKIEQLLADKTFTEGYYSQNAKIRAPYIARMEELQKAAVAK